MKEKILISFFILIILLFSNNNCLQSKIDLFQFGKVQNFEDNQKDFSINNNKVEEKSVKNNDESFSNKKNENLKKIKNLVNILVEKYEKLKSEEKIHNEKKKINLFDTIRFKSVNNENELKWVDNRNNQQGNDNSFRNNYSNDRENLFNKDDSPDNAQNNFNQSRNSDKRLKSFNDLKLPPQRQKENLLLKGGNLPLFPLHIITREPVILPPDEEKDVFIDKALIKKLKYNRKFGLQTAIRSIPIQECQINWDYSMHGDNWSCFCEIGENQSPINIKNNSVRPTNSNIYFEYKSPQKCGNDVAASTCKFPLIKNTIRGLELKYNIGYLLLPGNPNGFICRRIEFHTPSEHKINGKQYDLEMQIYCKLDKRKIKSRRLKITRAVIVVLFEGINDETLNSDKKYANFNNPFLEKLQLDRLPQKRGEAHILQNMPDFEELFNLKKQPDEEYIKNLISKKITPNTNISQKEVNTYKMANDNSNKISYKINPNTSLKEMQKLHYKTNLKNYQQKILSKIKSKLKEKKLAFKNKLNNHNTPFKKIEKTKGFEDSDLQKNRDFGINKPKVKSSTLKKKISKEKHPRDFSINPKNDKKIENRKNNKPTLNINDNKSGKVKKAKNSSGLFDSLHKETDTRLKSPNKNNFMNNHNQNEEEIIENNINYKISQDNEQIEKLKQNDKSLFSSSFIKIDELTYMNGQEQSDSFDNQNYDFFNSKNIANNNQANINQGPAYQYNPDYPLSEYYSYSGSGTSPPCEEKHTFIVYGNPVYARLSQIIKISSLISSTLFKLGNNRNVQKTNRRIVEHFQDPSILNNKKLTTNSKQFLQEQNPDNVFLELLSKNDERNQKQAFSNYFNDDNEILNKFFKLDTKEFSKYIEQKENEL